jgi:hypothetical protein
MWTGVISSVETVAQGRWLVRGEATARHLRRHQGGVRAQEQDASRGAEVQ